MTVQELIDGLIDAPSDAEIVVVKDSDNEDGLIWPEVAWWSDDKKTCYLGYL